MKTLRIGSLQEIKSGARKGEEVKIIGRYHNGVETCYICLSDEPTYDSLDMIRENRDNVVIGKVYQEVDMVDVFPESWFEEEEIYFTEEEKAIVGTARVVSHENNGFFIPPGTEVKVIGVLNDRNFNGEPLYLVAYEKGYPFSMVLKKIIFSLDIDENEKVWSVYGNYLTKVISNE